MSGGQILILIIVTALASSVCTLVLGWWHFTVGPDHGWKPGWRLSPKQ